jgi:hypothetical protein
MKWKEVVDYILRAYTTRKYPFYIYIETLRRYIYYFVQDYNLNRIINQPST